MENCLIKDGDGHERHRNENMSQEEKDVNLRVNLSLMGLAIVVQIMLVRVGHKIYKIVKFQDRILMAMIFFLNLEILSKIVFFVMNSIEFASKDFQGFSDGFWQIIVILPVIFLSIAVVINVRNWVYYLMKIGQMAYINEKKPELQKFHDNLDKRINCLNSLCLLAIGLNLTILLFVTVYHIIYPENLKMFEATQIFVGANFSILAVVYAVTSIKILQRLQKYFPQFYKQNRRMLISATIGLTLPLLFRGLIDNMRGLDNKFDDHVDQHQAKYNTILFIFGDLFPIGFQFSSLIFGYIRKRDVKKHKLEVGNAGQIDSHQQRDDDTISESNVSRTSSYFEPPLLKTTFYNDQMPEFTARDQLLVQHNQTTEALSQERQRERSNKFSIEEKISSSNPYYKSGGFTLGSRQNDNQKLDSYNYGETQSVTKPNSLEQQMDFFESQSGNKPRRMPQNSEDRISSRSSKRHYEYQSSIEESEEN